MSRAKPNIVNEKWEVGNQVPNGVGQRTLTQQEKNFVISIIAGAKRSDAYKVAYGKSEDYPDANLRSEAARAWKRPEVQRYYNRLMKKKEGEAVMTRHEKRTHLASIARNKSERAVPRILAIKADNEMTGDNAPVKTLTAVIGTDEIMRAVRSGKDPFDTMQNVTPEKSVEDTSDLDEDIEESGIPKTMIDEGLPFDDEEDEEDEVFEDEQEDMQDREDMKDYGR